MAAIRLILLWKDCFQKIIRKGQPSAYGRCSVIDDSDMLLVCSQYGGTDMEQPFIDLRPLRDCSTDLIEEFLLVVAYAMLVVSQFEILGSSLDS